MQICNLFLYHGNAVMWIFVKVLNGAVFTVIIYINCHLKAYSDICSCN